MKRRKGEPAREIAPFVDQWGQPAYSNPLGRYRPNPALDAEATSGPLAPPQPVETDVPSEARVHRWDSHERHLGMTEPLAEEAPPEELPVAETDSKAEVEPPAPEVELEAEVEPPAPEVELEAPSAEVRPDAPVDAPVASAAVEEPTEGTRAERLAEQLAQRRVRRRRRTRRSVVVVAAVGTAIIGVSAASAYFSPDGTNGDAADAATLSVTAFASAGNRSSPLLPGGTGDVMMQVNNPNSYAVTLERVAGGPFPSAVTGGPGCTVSNSGVKFVTPGALSVHLPANTISTVQLVGVATRSVSSARPCDGQTFTIPVSLTVRKA